MWHGNWGADDWLGMTLMMLLVWVPVIVLIVLLVRAYGSPRGAGGGEGDSAEEEARHAYARGDISREQFQQIVADLRQDRSEH